MRGISRTVLFLGIVSFLTDVSSEMIYPLLPVFLSATLGAGALALGLIEGVAESTSSLLKIASGWWSDYRRRRKPLILFGYTLAGAVRPLIGLATGWTFVLVLRFLDRVGKGLRTSPRDALIADVTAPGKRGAAFGFHRGMDHAGAVVGPLLAAFLLSQVGLTVREVFYLAAGPAALVVILLIFGIHEPAPPKISPQGPETPVSRPPPDRRYRLFLGAVALFTLGNSSDAFLLLYLSESGFSAGAISLLWSAHHVVKMLFSYAGGYWSDRAGARIPILAGWLLYAGIYASFGLLGPGPALGAVFLIYGACFGLAEPAEKSWVAHISAASRRATAFGLYHAVVGVTALPASLLFGLIWRLWGAPAAFLTGSALSLAAGALLVRAVPPQEIEHTTPPAP